MMKIRRLQLLRRTVQITVVLAMIAIPIVARYHNYLAARELDKQLERNAGTLAGGTLQLVDAGMRALPDGEKAYDGGMRRNRKQLLHYSQQVRGGVWSAQLGPVSLTDPLAGIESVAASKSFPWVLFVGMLIPVIVTLILGRVFCSWVCPMNLMLEMTDRLRKVLVFLELRPRNLRFSPYLKYLVLAIGILIALVGTYGFLSYIYPPAILNRETHRLVFGLFDHSEAAISGGWWGVISAAGLIVAGIALVEITVSRRWWCRYVCPGGAVYSLLGWRRLLRVRRSAPDCTHCGNCIEVCGMGLAPMRDKINHECDNCGLCVSHCPHGALGFAVSPKPCVPNPEQP